MPDDTSPAEDVLRAHTRAALRNAGISQAEAARQLGISTKHMCHMLTGRAHLTLPWAERILALCSTRLVITLEHQEQPTTDTSTSAGPNAGRNPMSYDISLYMTVDTGGSQPVEIGLADIGNYTANVSGMWTDALGHRLADLKGKTARDAVPALQRAVAAMIADPGKYEAMNPPNGWGNYDGALDYLRRLRDACIAHPKATIHITH